MTQCIFSFLQQVETIFWGYLASILIIFLGSFLTIQTRFFQIRALIEMFKTALNFISHPPTFKREIYPFKVFFKSIGDLISIGNVVGIVTAVQIGGPGALFWVWIAALLGAIVKYSEIFLGLKYRVPNSQGTYDGGPMFFLKRAFKWQWISFFVAALLCFYSIDIYQFVVITESISTNFEINRILVIIFFLLFVLFASTRGLRAMTKVCTWIVPFFAIAYLSMGIWILIHEAHMLPDLLWKVLASAFTGHAAVGGFAGSSALLAIQHGVSRATYSADIGTGYDAIMHSESCTKNPEKQARSAALGVGIDSLICSMSILVVLISGVWKFSEPLEGSHLVQMALNSYFPHMHLFIPVFLFVLGYSNIIAYFAVGIKCAQFIHPKLGKKCYLAYGMLCWIFFSFFDQTQALLIMSVSGALLLVTNLIGIFLLRHHVVFGLKKEKENTPPAIALEMTT